MPQVSCPSMKRGNAFTSPIFVTLVLIYSQSWNICAFRLLYGTGRIKGTATLVAQTRNSHSLFQLPYTFCSRTTTSIEASFERDNIPVTLDSYSTSLVESLDLAPLLEVVSLHAGTRRARQAFLALARADYEETLPKTNVNNKRTQNTISSRSRRASGGIELPTIYADHLEQSLRKEKYPQFAIAIAKNVTEARREYSRVAEAQLILKEGGNFSYPPLYGATSSPWDTEHVAETDYDSFLRHAVTSEESILEHIIYAQKIIETIRKVQLWGQSDIVREKAPALVEISSSLDYQSLETLYQEIAGTVAIKRVRTLTDPSGKFSFRFELNAEKFHVLQVLRTQVKEMEEKVGKKETGKASRYKLEAELSDLVEKLEATENDIQGALLQSILGKSKEINDNLDYLAFLDSIFAKAAFGENVGGLIPIIENEGKIDVHQFVHPVLLMSEETLDDPDIVPIDLRLSSQSKRRALIISGPNGGGKTAAMKSFGLAAILCQLGIPIPCRQTLQSGTNYPRVDFFRNIHVALGDRQSLIGGESTMMARLNSCAAVVQKVAASTDTKDASLVLIDEIGGGTDPDSGGAIAQAILEKLLETQSCRIVATTHVPRLKVLSYESKHFGCATVLLEASTDASSKGGYQKPSYELLYDSIGDSAALAAASRCTPSLPDDILSRASELVVESAAGSPHGFRNATTSVSSTNGAYLQALIQSMERQSERAQQARLSAEKNEQDTAICRRAMLSLALAYDREFQFLQQKLDDVYTKLKESDEEALEVVGATLAELRLIQKEIKSKSHLLAEKGLKLLPDWYDLRVGENIVIVSEDEMDGVSATVHLHTGSSQLKRDDVAVIPSLSGYDELFGSDFTGDSLRSGQVKGPLILKRSQVAIWDYDSMWDNDGGGGGGDGAIPGIQVTSVNDSRRRLNDILLNIKSSSSPSSSSAGKAVEPDANGQRVCTSARQRKAAAKKKSTKTTKGKRKQG